MLIFTLKDSFFLTIVDKERVTINQKRVITGGRAGKR